MCTSFHFLTCSTAICHAKCPHSLKIRLSKDIVRMIVREETSEDLLKRIEKRRQIQEKEQTNIGWYFWLLTEYPSLVICLCSVIIAVFTAVALLYSDHPDFSDPSKGFEVRGTKLSDRLVTWHNMVDQTDYNLTLSNYPYKYLEQKASAKKNSARILTKKENRSRRHGVGKKRVARSAEAYVIPPFMGDLQTDGYLENPSPDHIRWTYELISHRLSTLWSLEGMHSICTSQSRLLSHRKYADICIRHTLELCHPVMSLPNYVAYLSGLSRCQDLTQDALDKVGRILRKCAPHYCQGHLKANCWQSKVNSNTCDQVPKVCASSNTVYAIFNYLLDEASVCPSLNNLTFTQSMLFAPVFKHTNVLPMYFDNFAKPYLLSDGVTRITSMDFGVKDDVFENLLYSDTVYPVCAMAAVLLIILLYTSSIFITLMSFISTISAMFMSYFLYKIVFDFVYFPFLNLTAVLVMMGMSADNVLVFYSAWRSYAEEDARNLQQTIKGVYCPIRCRIEVVIKTTMRHVAWSLFVTGFTTAAAFLSNYSSSVTAIKCFGMYTGLTVLTNLFLCLTWLPATIIFQHKHLTFTCFKRNVSSCCKIFQWFYNGYVKLHEGVSELSRIFFHQIQVLLIVRLRFIWTFLYLSLIGGSLYVVLVYPGFNLPQTSTYFQYFKPSHPFEVYSFEKTKQYAFEEQVTQYLPVRVIFGVIPQDSGDFRNPDDTGRIQFNHRFNISHPYSQRWLLRFCREMRNSTYFQPVDTRESFSMCFIETFKEWMSFQDCLETICCNRPFPYPAPVFDRCLKEAMSKIAGAGGIHLSSYSSGPRYDRNDVIRALVVEFRSTVKYSSSFEEVGTFYQEVEEFLKPLLLRAPQTLARGWFVSDLEFYSLQSGLHAGTIASVGWSILVALLVIVITSRNLIVSFFATCNIAGIIFCTLASLVLMGWELNVLESITVSIAVGLSVDFTAHYAIAYIVAKPNHDRQQRVEYAASRLGPAITLAALTTFVAGAGMIPASVLAYVRFGVFLMIIMTLSWLLSCYFFLGLLSVFGPEGSRCNLACKCEPLPENDEHTTIMTETSTQSPPMSCHNEVIERATVI
ncbi:unnamed protein product [Clavelina lepadiformis]|uniref:SSD domain-containing protein n=1 Tax=Clavelina lepadiformis TaxID=159417 RepID=A0ABP0FPB4_CLALP